MGYKCHSSVNYIKAPKGSSAASVGASVFYNVMSFTCGTSAGKRNTETPGSSTSSLKKPPAHRTPLRKRMTCNTASKAHATAEGQLETRRKPITSPAERKECATAQANRALLFPRIARFSACTSSATSKAHHVPHRFCL